MKGSNKTLKILIIGDGGVGKTTLCSKLKKLFGEEEEKSYITTAKIDVNHIRFRVKNHNDGKVITTVDASIWDTAGQEKFGGLRDAMFLGTDYCFILYSVTDMISCKNVASWYRDINRCCIDCKIVLVGNKIDCLDVKVKVRQRVCCFVRFPSKVVGKQGDVPFKEADRTSSNFGSQRDRYSLSFCSNDERRMWTLHAQAVFVHGFDDEKI